MLELALLSDDAALLAHDRCRTHVSRMWKGPLFASLALPRPPRLGASRSSATLARVFVAIEVPAFLARVARAIAALLEPHRFLRSPVARFAYESLFFAVLMAVTHAVVFDRAAHDFDARSGAPRFTHAEVALAVFALGEALKETQDLYRATSGRALSGVRDEAGAAGAARHLANPGTLLNWAVVVVFALHFGLSAGARATSSPALRRGALRTLALACPMLWLRTIGTLGVFRSIEPMLWTLVSMLPEIDPRAALPPMTAYYVMKCGQTALVPYYRPGDPAVADAIRGLAGQYSSVLLANHGPVVSGDTLEAAVFATEELEETAKLYLLLRGLNPRYLSPEQVADLTKVFGLTLPEHGH